MTTSSDSPQPYPAAPGWVRIASAAAWVTLAVVLFAAAMTWGIGYDEEQYIAAPYFAQHLDSTVISSPFSLRSIPGCSPAYFTPSVAGIY